jgi:hypothetical protein
MYLCIAVGSRVYEQYWKQQELKPVRDGPFLMWPEHKWYGEFCMRCGARKKDDGTTGQS